MPSQCSGESGDLEGVCVCLIAPSINHLLFADDSLLLFKIDEQSTTHLQHILSLYEDCSGQIINKDKSSIMFSKNTNEVVRGSIMETLGIRSEAGNEKYLGLPVYKGQSMSGFSTAGSKFISIVRQAWMDSTGDNGIETGSGLRGVTPYVQYGAAMFPS
jgi:hypothetical protein